MMVDLDKREGNSQGNTEEVTLSLRGHQGLKLDGGG